MFYGFPTAETLEQVDAGRGVPGGCFVLPERPDWRGAACKHSWYDSDDPARQELDALIENLRRRRATP